MPWYIPLKPLKVTQFLKDSIRLILSNILFKIVYVYILADRICNLFRPDLDL